MRLLTKDFSRISAARVLSMDLALLTRFRVRIFLAKRFSLDAFLRPKMDFRDLDLVFYRLEQHPNFTTLIPCIELSLNGCFSLQLASTDCYNRSRGAVRLPQSGAPASCTRPPPYYVALLCVPALHAECGGLVQPAMTGHTSTTLLELSLSFALKRCISEISICFFAAWNSTF